MRGRSREQLLEQLRTLEGGKGTRATASVVRRCFGDAFLAALLAEFGSMHEARRSAKLPVGHRYGGRESIRDGLRSLHANGVRPVTKELVAAGEARLVSAIYRHYPSFPAAVRDAGLSKPPRIVKPPVSLDEARAHVQALTRQLGRTPRKRQVQWRFANRLVEEYGSWASAVDALGLDARERPNQRWTKSSVLERLRGLDSRGVRMTVDGLKAAGERDVVSAARRHWGSFAAARTAAAVQQPRTPSPKSSFGHLEASEVREARARYARGEVTQRRLAAQLGLSRHAMGRLLRHEVMAEAGGPKAPSSRRALSARSVVALRRRYATGRYTYRELADAYAISSSAVLQIVNGVSYRDVGGPIKQATLKED